ncbi:ABC transporter ATP-binding protein [Martelella soudanensis]|uniref:ABC transporter ATP-binding protein n=1 Tax=unclassified Martelella TaxID=2629616 RepID=UPI0015DF5763|nr:MULTISPECIES: ABC transporter ATP-binding protein [unclassified Martelella]
MTDDRAVLEVKNLKVTYTRGFARAPVTAVSDVSLAVRRGKTVSIVGESGSGKTTIGAAILGLQSVASGSIILNGKDITGLTGKERRTIRGKLQAVFQNPSSSLDPSKTVGHAIAEPLSVAQPDLGAGAVRNAVVAALERVGLKAEAMYRYPGEFSGGQCQRIAIARALIMNPEVVICDEAVSALDVSVQAQVLNLLDDLQRKDGVSYIFISHNMAVVRHISDRVVVLYRGRVMEDGPAEAVCNDPAHPYTRALLASVPVPDVAAQKERRRLRNETAQAASPAVPLLTSGCPFAPRCAYARYACTQALPPLSTMDDGRKVACVRIDEIEKSNRLEALSISPIVLPKTDTLVV